MLDKLEAIEGRFHYLEEKLSDPEIVSNMKQFTKTNKEYSALREIVGKIREYKVTLDGVESANKMMADPDPEMKQMAKMELAELKSNVDTLEEELKQLLIPKDPEDEKDVVVEIRAGAGGDGDGGR